MRQKTPESSSKSPISTRIQCLLIAFGALGLGAVTLKVLSPDKDQKVDLSLFDARQGVRDRTREKLSTLERSYPSLAQSSEQRSSSHLEGHADEAPISTQISSENGRGQLRRSEYSPQRTPTGSRGENSNNFSDPNGPSLHQKSDVTFDSRGDTSTNRILLLEQRLENLLAQDSLEISQITSILDTLPTETTSYDAESALRMLSSVLSVLENTARWNGQTNNADQRSQLRRSLQYVMTELTRGQPPILLGLDVVSVQERIALLELESRNSVIVNQIASFLSTANSSLQGDAPQYSAVFRQVDFVNLVTLLRQLREGQSLRFRPLALDVLAVLRTLKAGTDVLPAYDPLRRSLDQPGDLENPNPYQLEPKIRALEEMLFQ